MRGFSHDFISVILKNNVSKSFEDGVGSSFGVSWTKLTYETCYMVLESKNRFLEIRTFLNKRTDSLQRFPLPDDKEKNKFRI